VAGQHGARRPEGQPTRGKTAHNRLRGVDRFLQGYDPYLLRRRDGPFERAFYVDLGFGEEPITTLESARRLRQLNPELPILGVEIESERVARAQPHAGPLTFFRLGGFNLPMGTWPDGIPETVRLVRAFNVLRQYDEEAVARAHSLLFQHILPKGLLVEGTSNPFGSLWVANVLRSQSGTSSAWKQEALVFGINLRTGFDPARFQAVLPKSYIHRMVPGQPIHAFFEAWKQAHRETAPIQVWGPRQWFAATAQNLATRGYELNLRKGWLSKGILIWKVS
jgi:hypothetical protein